MLDYTEQCNRFKNEVNKEILDALKMPYGDYFDAVGMLEEAAKKINKVVEEGNANYVKALQNGISIEEETLFFHEGRDVNKKVLTVYKLFADEIERINAYDFVCLASVKYLQNVGMLWEVKELIESGDGEKAFETLLSIDLAASSYFFGEEVVEHMRKQICDPEFINRRTWAAGRELNVFSYYDLVQSFMRELSEGKGFTKTLKLLSKSVEIESSFIPQAMEREKESLIKAAMQLQI